MDRNTRIKELLDELAELGKDRYKPEYQETIPYWRKIGSAICTVADSSDIRGVFQLAYEVAEDWNHHSLCSALSWIYPKLEGTDRANKKYSNELSAIVEAVERDNVEVLMLNEWYKDEHPVRHARVTVNVEWLD